jgi:DNA segregation ATPase FtsK/SpoIIIE-like protein
MKTSSSSTSNIATQSVGLAFGFLSLPYVPLVGIPLIGVCGYGLVSGFFGNHRFRALLKELNLDTDLDHKEIDDESETYWFKCPVGKGLKDFENNEDRFVTYIGHPVKFTRDGDLVKMEIFKKPIKSYKFDVVFSKGSTVCAGKQKNGQPLIVEMNNQYPNLLIAGSSGGGKSVCLHGIITNYILLTDCNMKDIRLHLIDLKNGVALKCYKDSKYVASFSRTKAQAYDVLQKVNEEVDRRYDLFFNTDHEDYESYMKGKHDPMPTEIVVIDEFAQLAYESRCHEIILDTMSKSRACSIHFIIATQTIRKEILEGTIKNLLTNIIALRCDSEMESRLVLNLQGAEKLTGGGHGLYRNGKGELIEFQTPFIDSDLARQLIKHTNVDKSKKQDNDYRGF